MWPVGLILLTLMRIEADVRLNFTIKDYENKNDVDIGLRKCEVFSLFGDRCDPMFQFTVHVSNPGEESQLILKQEAGPFKNKMSIEHILDASYEQRQFPDLVEFDLDIQDNDADEDKRIARFRRQIPLKGIGKYALHMGADVRVSVLVSLECAPNFYGSKCEVYCVPMSGLWTCHNNTGSRICSKPCMHGSCILTNTSAVCLCSFGWDGELCDRRSESQLIDRIVFTDDDREFEGPQGTTISTEAKTLSTHVQSTTMMILSTPMSTEEWSTPDPTDQAIVSLEFSTEHNQTEQILLEQSANLIRENDTIHMLTGHAVATTLNVLSPLVTAVLTVIVIVIWLLVAVIIGFICYKRRKLKKTSVYSGSIWTNTTYDTVSQTPQKVYCQEYLFPNHSYQNTWSASPSRSHTLDRWNGSPSRPCSSVSFRGNLPRIPSAERDPLDPPPIITGSKIRFAATTVSTLPSSYKQSKTKSSNGISSDPYEELPVPDRSCSTQDTYDSVRIPLTSFRKPEQK